MLHLPTPLQSPTAASATSPPGSHCQPSATKSTTHGVVGSQPATVAQGPQQRAPVAKRPRKRKQTEKPQPTSSGLYLPFPVPSQTGPAGLPSQVNPLGYQVQPQIHNGLMPTNLNNNMYNTGAFPSPFSSPSPTNNPLKRKRTIACLNCHKNKKRCTEGLICSYCKRTERECIYPNTIPGKYQTGKNPTPKVLKRQEEVRRYQEEVRRVAEAKEEEHQQQLQIRQVQQVQQMQQMQPVFQMSPPINVATPFTAGYNLNTHTYTHTYNPAVPAFSPSAPVFGPGTPPVYYTGVPPLNTSPLVVNSSVYGPAGNRPFASVFGPVITKIHDAIVIDDTPPPSPNLPAVGSAFLRPSTPIIIDDMTPISQKDDGLDSLVLDTPNSNIIPHQSSIPSSRALNEGPPASIDDVSQPELLLTPQSPSTVPSTPKPGLVIPTDEFDIGFLSVEPLTPKSPDLGARDLGPIDITLTALEEQQLEVLLSSVVSADSVNSFGDVGDIKWLENLPDADHFDVSKGAIASLGTPPSEDEKMGLDEWQKFVFGGMIRS